MDILLIVYNMTTALLTYIVFIMVLRYVFLKQGFSKKIDGLYHVISCLICLACCLVDEDLYVSVMMACVMIYLYKSTDDKKKVKHVLLAFPAVGIVDGLILPFVVMPTTLLEVTGNAEKIYQIITCVILLIALAVFFFVGKNWRENYRRQLRDRSLRRFELVLICVIGILLLFFSMALDISSIYGNNQELIAGEDRAIVELLYELLMKFVMLIYGFSSFIMTATVIILVMVQNKQSYYHDKVRDMQFNIIIMMAEIVENRDKNTGGHIKRTARYVEIIAKQLQKTGEFKDILTDEYIKNLSVAAPLHDIGKIHVSDLVLNKPGRLTDEEFEEMKTHAAEGRALLTHAKGHLGNFKYLDMAIEVAGSHHEWWDGSKKGYPDGLKGEDIPLSARIMAVADVFDALTSKRVYKDPMPVDKAFGIIRQESGTHFDPVVTHAFFTVADQVKASLEEFLNDDSATDCLVDADHMHEHMHEHMKKQTN